MTPVPSARDLLLARVAAHPSPTRQRGRLVALGLLALSVGVAVGILWLMGGPAGEAARPRRLTWLVSGVWGLFAAALSGLVFTRKGSVMGRPPSLLLLAAFATPLVLLAWLHSVQGSYPEPYARVGWRCLSMTLGMAALPLGSFLLLRRGIEPRGPWALGAAVGATCGAWANLLVDVWCPLSDTAHVLVGHVLPVVVLVLAGSLLGRRLLGVRPLPPPAR